jgi:hypothetical protein
MKNKLAFEVMVQTSFLNHKIPLKTKVFSRLGLLFYCSSTDADLADTLAQEDTPSVNFK